MVDCERLIVIDACSGGGSPAAVTRLEWPDERIDARHSYSTHGMGIVQVLQLEERLGRLPSQVVLFGIELSQCGPGDSLSGAIESTLSEIEERILLEINN